MTERLSLKKTVPVDRYWSTDQGLTALLVSIALLTFVFLPIEASGLIGPRWFFFVDAWIAGVLLAGASSLGWHRVRLGILMVELAIVLVVLGLRIVARGLSSAWSEALSSGVSALVFAAMTALILARVFRDGPTTRHRIFGAVAAYLLLGLIWAEAYRVLDALSPGSIGGIGAKAGPKTLFAFVYFSLTTLTTAGFGDILPVSLPARSLAGLESMTGMLFPAVLIARLVAMSLANPSQGS
jgi:hypothetical protein